MPLLYHRDTILNCIRDSIRANPPPTVPWRETSKLPDAGGYWWFKRYPSDRWTVVRLDENLFMDGWRVQYHARTHQKCTWSDRPIPEPLGPEAELLAKIDTPVITPESAARDAADIERIRQQPRFTCQKCGPQVFGIMGAVAYCNACGETTPWPQLPAVEQHASSLQSEIERRIAEPVERAMSLLALARRVVEILQPMQDKGQNGDTFERLLKRAKAAIKKATAQSAAQPAADCTALRQYAEHQHALLIEAWRHGCDRLPSKVHTEIGDIIATPIPAVHPSSVDDPDLDCTDAAHPAWWRGHEHGLASASQHVVAALEGEPVGSVSPEPWDSIKERIAKLVQPAEWRKEPPDVPGVWESRARVPPTVRVTYSALQIEEGRSFQDWNTEYEWRLIQDTPKPQEHGLVTRLRSDLDIDAQDAFWVEWLAEINAALLKGSKP